MKRCAALLILLSSCATSEAPAARPAGGKVSAVRKEQISWQQAPVYGEGRL